MARPWLLLALPLLALAAGPLPAKDADPDDADPNVVEARLEWEPGRLGGYAAMFIPFRTALPKGLTPLAAAADARYARIRWGDGPGLTLALDVSPGRERLWIDLDLDGDLAGETRTSWFGAGKGGTRDETVLVRYGEGDPGDPVPVRFFRSPSWAPDRVRITPWMHRRGEVVLGGRLRAVALVDDNSDLRFDDPKRDKLFLDVDGDGSFATATNSHERIGIGEAFRLGEEAWRAEVPSPSGTVVRFVRIDEAAAPSAAPRTWPRVGVPTAGVKPSPPAESLEALTKRIEAERELAYADRYRTVNDVGRVGTQAAFDLLVALIERDADVNVKSAAARALGNVAYRELGAKEVAELAQSAWTPPAVRSALAQALHGMDHPGRYAIYRELLTSNEAVVIGAAAKHLVYLGTDEAVGLATRLWASKPPDAVRYQIYLALRTRPEGPPTGVVLEAAAATHASLAGQALRDLRALDHPRAKELAIAAALREPPVEYVQKAAAEVLGQIGDAESVKALLAVAATATPALELHIAKQLAPVRDPKAIDTLVKALKAKETPVRALAAQILAGISLPRVTEALLARARREKDTAVLVALLEALGDQGSEKAADLLLKQAKRRKSEVREAAIRALARLGLDHARVRTFFLSLLTSKRWEDRVLAIDAAAAAGDPKLCAKVIPSLGHDRHQVRIAAAEALALLRCPAAIEPLIARLEEEEEVRVTDTIATALYQITGMNLYDDAPTWRKWWKAEGARFEVPETVRDLPAEGAGGTRAGFYGIPVRSGRVIFVIDQSGSMSAEDPRPATTGAPSGNRLDVAIKEVLGAVKGMHDRDYVNVVLFHTTIHAWQKTGLQRLTSKNRSALSKHLGQQKPTGGTNLYDGLELALQDEDVDTIFLLSDGVPGSGRYVARDDILRAVKRLNQTKRVAVNTVSIGRDSELLRLLAEQNGGKYARR